MKSVFCLESLSYCRASIATTSTRTPARGTRFGRSFYESRVDSTEPDSRSLRGASAAAGDGDREMPAALVEMPARGEQLARVVRGGVRGIQGSNLCAQSTSNNP